MKHYSDLAERHTGNFKMLDRKYTMISIIRLVVVVLFLISLYYYVSTRSVTYLVSIFTLIVLFIILIKVHVRLAWDSALEKNLSDINENEMEFIRGLRVPFANGEEFMDTTHLYSYDLDFFGENSFFQNLNRTGTYMGKRKLAGLLLSVLSHEEIIENQQAIRELAPKIEFRQKLLALANTGKDNRYAYENVIRWSSSGHKSIPKILQGLAFVTPVLLVIFIVAYFYSGNTLYINLAAAVFLFNLILLSLVSGRIKHELMQIDKVQRVIKHYGRIIGEIEKQDFNSKKLINLKNRIRVDQVDVGRQIEKLSLLFGQLEGIKNVFGATLFNGIFLYHHHVLNAMYKWRNSFSQKVPDWLSLIAEFEALNSLANFSFNNPNFVFPEICKETDISFEALGHPLIAEEKRVCNTINFSNGRFIILTGSNMAGKSTFLRTLGINMILAGIGSPVCASKARVHPLPVMVSMRLSDSLHDNESYFFKEVKRLKEIMDRASMEICFVILDEILRGTNSDDKRNGTIGVIRKIIDKAAIGAIATHDLEICKTAEEFPDILCNKCFEVEIINDDLFFDYKLKDGICRNKSATFLMKKMEVI